MPRRRDGAVVRRASRQLHRANLARLVDERPVVYQCADVAKHELKFREVVPLRREVWVVVPVADEQPVLWILPVCVWYAHGAYYTIFLPYERRRKKI